MIATGGPRHGELAEEEAGPRPSAAPRDAAAVLFRVREDGVPDAGDG